MAMTGYSAQQPPSPVLSSMGLTNTSPNELAFETGLSPLSYVLPYILLEDMENRGGGGGGVCAHMCIVQVFV